jgi:hypothetical protein
MADKKISALTASSTPLAGTEVLPIVQSGSTVKVSVNNLTAGKSVSMKDFTANSGAANQECRLQYSDNTGGRTVILRMSSSSLAPFDGYGAYIKATQGGGVDVHSLAFGTTIGTPSDKLTVRYDGLVTVETDNLKIGTAGKGIDFSAATHAAGMTSELLNDYEEGTYTVAIGCGTSGTVTLNTAYDTAQYTKVGRLVTVTGGVIVSSVSSPTGYFTISLPFSSASLSELSGYFLSVLTISGVNTANIADFVSLGVTGASSIRIYLGDATGLQGDSAQELKAGTEIYFTVSYIAA